MKTFFATLLTLFLFSFSLFGQNVPQAFNYQGMVTDANDAPVTTQIGLQIKLLQGSNAGPVVYTETHTPTPNLGGIFNVEIGNGTSSDVFGDIDWLADKYFVEIGVDIAGGTNYAVMNAVELLSVPYALAAEEAESLQGFPLAGTPNNGDVLTWDGVSWSPMTPAPTGVVSITGGSGINVSSDGSGNETIEAVLGTSIGNAELETDAVTSGNILDYSIQAVDLEAGVIPSTSNFVDVSSNQIIMGNKQFNDTINTTSGYYMNGNLILHSDDAEGLYGFNLQVGREAYAPIWADWGGFNTSVGVEAGKGSTRNANTLIGTQAGKNLNGGYNLIAGCQAGFNVGEGNVILGRGAGNSVVSNNIIIGHNAANNQSISNQLYIENSDSSTPLIHGDFSTDDITINGDFTVTGEAYKPGNSTWVTTSDKRLKDIGKNYQNGLSQINQITPIYYNYKKDNPLNLPSEQTYIGIIAQELQKAIPEAVSEDQHGYLQVNNDPVIWALVNATKELSNKVDKLEEENLTLLSNQQTINQRNAHLLFALVAAGILFLVVTIGLGFKAAQARTKPAFA